MKLNCSSRSILLRCYERLGGMNPLQAQVLCEMMTRAFEKSCKACKENSYVKEAFNGKAIAAIAIRDSIYDGFAMAYLSGLGHRISPSHANWQAVHSPTLKTDLIENHHDSTNLISVEEALQLVEPQYLGASAEGLLNMEIEAKYDNEAPSLFVYPENWLVPKEMRQVVNKIANDPRINHAIIITKEPVILTDFFNECVTVITREDND